MATKKKIEADTQEPEKKVTKRSTTTKKTASAQTDITKKTSTKTSTTKKTTASTKTSVTKKVEEPKLDAQKVDAYFTKLDSEAKEKPMVFKVVGVTNKQESNKAVVTAPTARVSVGPGMAHRCWGYIPVGTSITILEERGNFVRFAKDKWINVNSIKRL